MYVNEKMKEIVELFQKRKKEGKETTLRFFKDSGYLDVIKETGVSLLDAHYPKTDTDTDIQEKIISEKFKDLVVDSVSITQKFLGTSYEHTIYRIYINMDESKNTDVIDQIIRSLTPKQQ